MADDRFTSFRIHSLEQKTQANVLGARTANAELNSQVVAERAGDEEQRLAIFNRWLELAMRAREHRRTPRVELVRLEAAREKHCMPAHSSKLTLELARADGRDRTKGAK